MSYLASSSFHRIDLVDTVNDPIIQKSTHMRYPVAWLIAPLYPFVPAPFSHIYHPLTHLLSAQLPSNPSALSLTTIQVTALECQLHEGQQQFLSSWLSPVKEHAAEEEKELLSTPRTSLPATPLTPEHATDDRDSDNGHHVTATTLRDGAPGPWIANVYEDWQLGAERDNKLPCDAPHLRTDNCAVHPTATDVNVDHHPGVKEDRAHERFKGIESEGDVVDATSMPLRIRHNPKVQSAHVDASGAVSVSPARSMTMSSHNAFRRDFLTSIVDAYSVDIADECSTCIAEDEKLVANIIVGSAFLMDDKSSTTDDSFSESSFSALSVDTLELGQDTRELKTPSIMSLSSTTLMNLISHKTPSRGQDMVMVFGLAKEGGRRHTSAPEQKACLSWMDTASIAERAGPQRARARCLSALCWAVCRWWEGQVPRRDWQTTSTWIGPTRPAAIMVDVTVERQ